MGTIPITGHTGLTCLLGQPVAHSVSPEMHNESFRYHGLDYVYLAFDVAPEQFEAAVDGLITFNARGWNCTMPHKRRTLLFNPKHHGSGVLTEIGFIQYQYHGDFARCQQL